MNKTVTLLVLALLSCGVALEAQGEQKRDSSDNARQRTRDSLDRSTAYRQMPKEDSLRSDCTSRSLDCPDSTPSEQGGSQSNGSQTTGSGNGTPRPVLPAARQRVLDSCVRQQMRRAGVTDTDAYAYCKEKYSELQ